MTANVSTVNLGDGRVVTLSYGVPVAVFCPPGIVHTHPSSGPVADWYASHDIPFGYLKTDRKYSSTSSRHANLFAKQNGSTTKEIPHAVFRQLVAPVAVEE